MNILFLPQYANRSYSSGKWSLLKDGHIGMIKNQIKTLLKYDEYTFSLIVPQLSDIEDIDNYEKLFFEDEFKKIKIHFFPFKLSKNVAYNRFHFDMNQFMLIDDFDLIITDVPELTRNIKMHYVLQKKNIKIISNVHYLDIYPENQVVNGISNYFWSQLNGLICSDAITFLTKKYYQDFFDYAKKYVTNEILVPLIEKSVVLDFMAFSEDSLNLFKKEKNNEKIIFFISRCSDDKRTKWREFILSVKLLRKLRQDFKVFIANPTHINSEELSKEIGDAFDYISFPLNEFSKQDYVEKLWESHCVPLLYDIRNNLAVGFYEAMFCNNVPVQYGRDFGDVNVLDLALSSALDKKAIDYIDRKNEFIQNHSSEYNSNRFNSFIKKVIE
jgi:hypothetical protein